MARVVDCWPSSDDEQPEVKTSLTNALLAKSVNPIAMSKISSQKDLVPKSTSKPRRVRRLDGSALLTSGNVLLQKFDASRHEDSPRRSPVKRGNLHKDESSLQSSIFDDDTPLDCSPTKRGAPLKETSMIQPSIFDQDDAPPATVRTSRIRRTRLIQSFQDDSEDEDSQPSMLSIKPLHFGPLRVDPAHRLRIPSLADASSSSHEQVKPDAQSDKTVEAEQNLVDAQLASEFQAISLADQDSLEQKACEANDTTCAGTDFSNTSDDVDSSGSSAGSNNDSAGDLSQPSVQESSVTTLAVSSSNSTLVSDSQSLIPSKRILSPKKTGSLNHQAYTYTGEAKMKPTASLFRPSTRPREAEKDGSKVSSIDLTNELSKLRLDIFESSDQENELLPETPSKPRKTKRIVSLNKPTGLPKTLNKPTDDAFWDQDVVNDWNDKHSPRKPSLSSSTMGNVSRSPTKEGKKSFNAKKHTIASDFLQELDEQITQGRISQLAESTGGVSLVWSKTLNTTAGRANWKRETIRTKNASGEEVSVQYKHHASIELAEKVINDENRLCNVVAHEFCHLANFMINGITNNPHGKEFKVWAAQCSRAFGSRGIEVTTKHTYDIDYKYVWECVSCGSEFKRHSKSIDPLRHRCGTCKNTLKQVRPVPRGSAKPSDYQVFMKEQMKIVKSENPDTPQKDIMRIIAEKWAGRPKLVREPAVDIQEHKGNGDSTHAQLGDEEVQVSEMVVSEIIDLTLDTSA